MTLVLDASVVVKLLVSEDGTAEAIAVLAEPHERIAPDWLTMEVASALWNKVKYSGLPEVVAERSLAEVPKFLNRFELGTGLLDAAFRLSFQIRHPVYDCLYLALAMREDAVLVTADTGMAKAARRGKLDDHVRLLTWPGGAS